MVRWILGTAGTGKTSRALEEAGAAARAGQKVLNIKDFSSRLGRLYPELEKKKSGTKNGYWGISINNSIVSENIPLK